jgi:uncharacterized lipoprotein YmbA
MRALALAMIASGLAACASTGAPSEGVASLDALRSLQASCEARGMTMQLKSQGDPQRIDAYACVRK